MLIRITKENCNTQEVPYGMSTLKLWRTEGRYPGVVLKLGNKLFFDTETWREIIAKERERQVEEAYSRQVS